MFYVEVKNRLPGKIFTVKHKLEYGEATMQVQEGSGKVLIFDDVIATGVQEMEHIQF